MSVHRRDVGTRKKKVRCGSQVPMGDLTGIPDLVHRFIVAFHGWYHVLRYELSFFGSSLAAF